MPGIAGGEDEYPDEIYQQTGPVIYVFCIFLQTVLKGFIGEIGDIVVDRNKGLKRITQDSATEVGRAREATTARTSPCGSITT